MMVTLTTSQREIIYYCDLAVAVLSLIGGLFIIILFLTCKSLQTYPFKLISILALFDLFNAIGFMLPTYDAHSSQIICKAQGIIVNFFTLASILWSAVIAFSLYLITLKSMLYVEKYLMLYVIIVLSLCAGDSLVPYMLDSYGTVAGWCWITQRKIGDQFFFERYLLFFGPLWVVVICNILLYVIIANRLRKTHKESKNLCNRISLSNKLKYYPLILIICYLPYTVKGAMDVGNDILSEDMEYYFTIIAGIARGINGILNAIAYGLTKKVKNKLAHLLSKKKTGRHSLHVEIRATLTNSAPNSKYTIFTNRDILSSQESLRSN